jgi:hypothetical protein
MTLQNVNKHCWRAILRQFSDLHLKTTGVFVYWYGPFYFGSDRSAINKQFKPFQYHFADLLLDNFAVHSGQDYKAYETYGNVQIKISYVALNFLCLYLVLIWTLSYDQSTRHKLIQNIIPWFILYKKGLSVLHTNISFEN